MLPEEFSTKRKMISHSAIYILIQIYYTKISGINIFTIHNLIYPIIYLKYTDIKVRQRASFSFQIPIIYQ